MAGEEKTLDVDLDALYSERAGMLQALRAQIEKFCTSAPLAELNVVFHSTGVNYAHQFYALSLFGPERLRQLRSVHFVSGSVIAAVVFYSHQTDNLQYGSGDSVFWEQRFFDIHKLSPTKSIGRLLRGLPVLCGDSMTEVIQDGIGKHFGNLTVNFFPENFYFWLYDSTSGQLMNAMAGNHLSSIRLIELAMAATAVPWLLPPVEIGQYTFVDPIFSPGRKLLPARLREMPGPLMVSNMLHSGVSRTTEFVRPHVYSGGKMLLARELFQMFLGRSNRDHLAALEIGLIKTTAEEE